MSLPWLRDTGPPSSRQRETGKRWIFHSGSCGWKSGGGGWGWGSGWWDSHEDFRVGVDWRCWGRGNRNKQGSDGDDDDGGTWTRPGVSVCHFLVIPEVRWRLRVTDLNDLGE